MSSKRSKARKWQDAVKNLDRMNSVRLQARWFAHHITKDAFLTKHDKAEKKYIVALLKKRGVKVQKPRKFTER